VLNGLAYRERAQARLQAMARSLSAHAIAEPLAKTAEHRAGALRLSRAIHVALAEGRVRSFSTAAVMMPRVPSAPTKSCFRSWNVLSLRRLRSPFRRYRRAELLEAQDLVARIAVAKHVHAACVRRENALTGSCLRPRVIRGK
jgi:hypothetical protein